MSMKHNPKDQQFFFILALITFIIVTTLIFLVGENFKKDVPVNHDKIASWGTFIGSILTAITVFLLFRQNQHLAEERKAAIQPDLHPADSLEYETKDNVITNYAYSEHQNPLDNPLFYRKRNSKLELVQDISFQLHNIGLGVAKNINVNWVFSNDEVLAYAKTSYPHMVNEWDENEPTQVIAFIAANTSVEYYMPSDYIKCFGKKLNNSDGHDLAFNCNIKPKLYFDVSYRDAYNTYFNKTFEMTTNCNDETIQFCFTEVFDILTIYKLRGQIRKLDKKKLMTFSTSR